jgi:DNA topoisomerase-1
MSAEEAIEPGEIAPKEIAEEAGLRYVTDTKPGYTRKKHGKEFEYFDTQDKKITDEKILTRIKSIGVPPAYENVWICPQVNGHLQATGLDARGRKQYRYHVKWRATRDENKFHHILHFGDILPKIRERIESDLKLDGLPREKVLACVVSLMEKTLIRIGNQEYARDNQSYGLTTLRRKHVHVTGNKIAFSFKGKSGKEWDLSINDRRIANIVSKCADIPGHELFKYITEDGTKKEITSADVNDYLRDITGEHFTAKDFRTWSGTVLAALALSEFEKYDSEAQAKKNVVRAIEHVAKQLGNTPAICRKCYIHPEIINSYLSGDLADAIRHEIDAKMKKDYEHMADEEIMVLAFLKKRLGNMAK